MIASSLSSPLGKFSQMAVGIHSTDKVVGVLLLCWFFVVFFLCFFFTVGQCRYLRSKCDGVFR